MKKLKAKPACLICSLNQVLTVTKRITTDPETEKNMLNKAMRFLIDYNWDLSPAEIASDLFRLVCRELDSHDPYRKEMDYYNRQGLKLYPQLQKIIADSNDPLHTALLTAVAGNQIDLGIISEINIEETITGVLRDGLAYSDYPNFRKDLENTGSLLYLVDNAGEIVFDRLFLEEIKKIRPDLKIKIAVKKEPAANDALRSDALEAGLDKVGEIIDTGCGDLGVPKSRCSREFLSVFQQAGLIIAKGHANFETIEEPHPAVYVLLRAKCPVVAEALGVQVMDSVFKKLNLPGNLKERENPNPRDTSQNSPSPE